MNSSVKINFRYGKYVWVLVPVISFLGIFLGIVFNDNPILAYAGIAGCVISSFLIGAMAALNPKKDILALLAPLYAVIIFNPWSEYSTGVVMQVLYSLTILVVVVRFEKRFHSNNSV